MKTLLIVTQVVDHRDDNLGFFHRWLEKFSEQGNLIVIANRVGEARLPANVKVYSLGKERGYGRLRRFFIYRWLLLQLLWKVDGIFYHMCPEYVLAAAFCPKLFRKKTALWYVHKNVDWKLRWAERLVDKVFTASLESFRLPSSKVSIIGHGIDMDWFQYTDARPEKPIKLLVAGRIAPVKDLRTMILALAKVNGLIAEKLELDIVGDPILAADRKYAESLRTLVKELGIESQVHFRGGTVYEAMQDIYRSHHWLLHASQTGSLDKAVLEALACGVIVFTSSEAYDKVEAAIVHYRAGHAQELAEKIAELYNGKKQFDVRSSAVWVRSHYGLDKLIQKITQWYLE